MRRRLTRSELMCVRLAGEGLSDKQIRERLGMGSFRTVQSHLSTAYEKLGVRDRYAAAELVRREYVEAPIPIPLDPDLTPHGPAPERAGSPALTASSPTWPLPSPPRRSHRLIWVLAFSVLGVLMTVCVVAIVLGLSNALNEAAPPNALRSLD